MDSVLRKVYPSCFFRRDANAARMSRFIQWGNSLSSISSSVIQKKASCSGLSLTSPPVHVQAYVKIQRWMWCLMASNKDNGGPMETCKSVSSRISLRSPSSAFSKKCSPPPISDGCSYSCTPFHAWNGKAPVLYSLL